MTKPSYTALAASLPASVPFVSPDTQQRLRGEPYRARLGANENGFGPSPNAIKAMADAAPECWMYGDELSFALRQALAEKFHISLDNIVVGEGIDSLLGNLVRLLVEKDTPVVTSIGAYPTFNYHVAGFGGKLHAVPYKNDHEDLEGLAEIANKTAASLVYLANPDNPMGTWHTGTAIMEFVDQLPDGCLLCLDEAYIEFAPEGISPEIDVNDQRIIRFRTFSKAHGLAGARIGYGIAHTELISAFNKVRNHFGVNRIGQAAALAALADDEWLDQTIAKVTRAKAIIADIARDNGLTALPSASNFVAIDLGRDGEFSRKVVEYCDQKGIFIRRPFASPQDRCLRVSAGPDAELQLFAEVLPQALRAC